MFASSLQCFSKYFLETNLSGIVQLDGFSSNQFERTHYTKKQLKFTISYDHRTLSSKIFIQSTESGMIRYFITAIPTLRVKLSMTSDVIERRISMYYRHREV
jgi:hypothetical protein